MVDKIDKALLKLSPKIRQKVKQILQQILRGDTDGLDVKKLKGRTDIYRVRKGQVRIIFHRKEEKITVLAIEKRNDHTY